MDDLSEKYRRFAALECKDYSPAYYQLALEVADDAEILGFLSRQPVTQPNLLFAAVQYLTGPRLMPLSGAALRDFLRTKGEHVTTLMHTRRTQTNEVGRCATLLPALPSGPLALVEVGAAAGLCLLLDRYHYDYGFTCLGDPESSVTITCRVQGDVPRPLALPNIAWRRGLDMRPLNVKNQDDAKWLLAHVWPDHPQRRQRLEAAISLAVQNPPLVTRGDLATDLGDVLAEAPADALLVVFHSGTLPYVTEAQKHEFVAALVRESHRRDVVWISNESCGALPDLARLTSVHNQRSFLLGRTILSRGRRQDSVLGLSHPHGAELTWLNAHCSG